MVPFNVIIMSTLMLVTIVGCKGQSKKAYLSDKGKLLSESDSINYKYCFMEIKDSLKNTHAIIIPNKPTDYYNISKEELLKYQGIKGWYLENIAEFYDYTVFTDSYVIKHDTSEFVILIGQSAGATGIGVDYWSYRYYPLNGRQTPTSEFSSLVKTPYSLFIDDKGQLNHIEIESNYPRPASGEEVILDHMPLIISVFKNEKKISSLNFKCKTR